jgi:hypothetical protein
VVSRLIPIVVTLPSAAISRNSRGVEPRAARAQRPAAASKTPCPVCELGQYCDRHQEAHDRAAARERDFTGISLRQGSGEHGD